MIRLVNRLLCAVGVHSAYFVEEPGTGLVVEHCRWCSRIVPLYRRRRW